MIDKRPERKLSLCFRRLLPATPQEVFEAWIDPQSMREWMCPGTTSLVGVKLDVRVGGSFRIVMRNETDEVVHTGEYREIRPPERLVFTWQSSMTANEETLVTVELFPRGEGTELVLTHERLPDELSARKHDGGWQSIVEKLGMYLGADRRQERGHKENR